MNMLTAIANGSPLADVRATLNCVIHRVFDVTIYGAVADSAGTIGSGTDSTAAFMAAIAAAKAAGGGVVYKPSGTFRLATAALVVDASNITIEGPGRLFFDSADVTSFGRVLFDGGVTSGEITNSGISGGAVSSRANIAVSGAEPGYNGSACLVTFRGVANFLCRDVELFASPNYGVSVLRCRNTSAERFTGIYGHDLTADVAHIQDGCDAVFAGTVMGENVGDDIVGLGYWGAPCGTVGVENVRGKGCGACGVAVYGALDTAIIGAVSVESTFNAAFKVAAASKAGGTSNAIRKVVLRSLEAKGAGMRPAAAFSRGDGPACLIHIAPGGGTIGSILVDQVAATDTRNSFLVVDPTGGGSVGFLGLGSAAFGNIAATGGAGATTSKNPDGTTATGYNRDTPDPSHPGIIVPGIVARCVIAGPVDATGAAGTAIINNAVAAITSGALPVAASSVVAPIAADTFDRADIAPAIGALGSTSTGAKKWTGAAAGIAGNKAYMAAGGYNGTAIDAGSADLDVSVTMTMTGAGGRVVARCGADPTTGTGLILIPSGTLGYYDGSKFYTIANFTGSASGTHTARLVVKGNVATGYIDGTQVGTGQPQDGNGNIVTMATTTYAGIQDDGGAGGTARYDNFSVSVAA